MSRAYGRENKNHIKRGGNNDSEIAWTSEKNPKKNPRYSRGLSVQLWVCLVIQKIK